MEKELETILKQHTAVNKIQIVGPVWNAGIVGGIQTSGHFVLFEDALAALRQVRQPIPQSRC